MMSCMQIYIMFYVNYIFEIQSAMISIMYEGRLGPWINPTFVLYYPFLRENSRLNTHMPTLASKE